MQKTLQHQRAVPATLYAQDGVAYLDVPEAGETFRLPYAPQIYEIGPGVEADCVAVIRGRKLISWHEED